MPMPEQVFLAMVALALHWEWPDVACYLVIGFLGMLRPGECVKVTPKDISFLGSGINMQSFVFIGKPKMRRVGPRREHIRIDDPELIPFLSWIKTHFPPDRPVFHGSALQLRQCFDSLCRALHLPTQDGKGLTPASIRAGGATFWYRKTDSTEWLRFRGRWASSRMLEVYIQEVAALSLQSHLPPSDWEHICRIAALATPALYAFT